MSQLIIGLTGGIGSGKTTVSDLFAQKGIVIVDADIIAREVVAPGTPALQAIAERFGPQVLSDSGELDRKALRAEVFSEPGKQQWLNQLLHPLIREQMISQSQGARSPYCILAIPLLVENQLQALVSRVLVVDVPEATQLQRASARDSAQENADQQQIKNIMAAQCPRDVRLAAADDVIHNDAGIEALAPQVEKLHQFYTSLIG